MAQKKPVITDQITLYLKSVRGGMSDNKINNLFDQDVSKPRNKYELLDLKIDNTNKIKEIENLETTIELTHINHVKYDLHDVFTVVKLHQNPNESKTTTIYTDYPYLTAKDVDKIN